MGRAKKWLRRFWFDRRSPLTRIERTVDLEPYGDAGSDAAQGAVAAHRALEAALSDGEVAVLSIHRVQLVSMDAAIAAAGRRQLAEVIRLLEESGGVRWGACLRPTTGSGENGLRSSFIEVPARRCWCFSNASFVTW